MASGAMLPLRVIADTDKAGAAAQPIAKRAMAVKSAAILIPPSHASRMRLYVFSQTRQD
jgi:hypothetical protein